MAFNRLDKVEGRLDAVSDQLAKTARKLEAGMSRLITEGKQGEAMDAALARVNIENLMIESGYYNIVGEVVNNDYTRMIDWVGKEYGERIGKTLQYSDVSLERLDQIRNLDAATFNSIAEDNIGQLQRVMTDYQFGATSMQDAIAAVERIAEKDMERYAETVIRSTAMAFDREASNLLASDAGIDKYEYIGPDDDVTRDFCADLIGEIKTMEEWQAMKNPGGYSVATYGGGVNCRHSLAPVVEPE